MHLPFFQSYIGSEVADALSRKFGTKVSVGKVDLGFLNRIIVDDLVMLDQQNDSMLMASRVSAKFDILPLANGKIEISSTQFFGLNAKLYKQKANSKPNFQFVIDSLASKDTTKHTPLDLKISSLIIRHGNIRYDDRFVKETNKILNLHHLRVSNLSTHLILNHLTDNEIDLNVKKISFQEKSGLDIRSLKFRFSADKKHASLKNFNLQLPNTEVSLDDIDAKYSIENGKIEMPTLEYNGSISNSTITLSDLAFLVPQFNDFNEKIHINTEFTGTSTSVRIRSLNINSENDNIQLVANGTASNWSSNLRWFTTISKLRLTSKGIQNISTIFGKRLTLPKEVSNLGDISFNGNLGGNNQDLAAKGELHTDAGNAKLALGKHNNDFTGLVETDGINIKRILNNPKFGIVKTKINISGSINPASKLPAHLQTLDAKGTIPVFDYNGHRFQNIILNANLVNGIIKGDASINDPLVSFDVKGLYNLTSNYYDVDGQINHVSPSRLLGIKTKDNKYMLADVNISASKQKDNQHLYINTPFADVKVDGQYDYATIVESFTNLIGSKVPTIPGLPRLTKGTSNNFSISAKVSNDEWIKQLLNIPLTINDTVRIEGVMNDYHHKLNLNVSLPDFKYDDTHFKQGSIAISTPNDTLFADVRVNKVDDSGGIQSLSVRANAADNKVSTLLSYNNNSKKLPIRGQFDTDIRFFTNDNGQSSASMTVNPSNIQIGDSTWNIQSSEVLYTTNRLEFKHFAIQHGEQYIYINGLATKDKQDSITVDLNNIDISYILNLVNFHSVDFTGKATGQAYISSVFNDPDAKANLTVRDFTFEDGRMGTLYANCFYNKETKAIDIDATADDGPDAKTYIKGYVSPANNDILLNIEAQGTRMEFLESFTGSIMSNIDGHIYGDVSVIGPISKINLIGNIHATGSMHMKQLNTDYHFENIHVVAVPNEIKLVNDTVFDRNGNIGIVNGALHHTNLTRLSYDLDIDVKHLLCYDTHEFGTNTFYGTIYGTGTCSIHGKSGEIVLDINATPERGSTFVYNAASPDAIEDQSFIHWHDATPKTSSEGENVDSKKDSVNVITIERQDIPSDLRINFLINCNPKLTLKIMMDNTTGDYIALNGDGVIKANYFNKGSFNMYGNYVIDHGTYKFTVQNVIKKDFQIVQGGTISFGGDAYNAALNLMAKYTVNGVSLSDLNIGNSFSSNNIRVDCLMNITGTPNQPKVDFSLDMPTVGNDAKQMVMSLINSEEEMRQQVLYLLLVGRFYVLGNNNATVEDAQQQSQTSLAMQSLLSGTISQQINNVLSNVINNNDWNFGANISTGDEGWNNAEYEGMFSGRMFNNRLVFNGQFGYRDNPNATTSFIGDFDLRYLLYPNGNFAVRVYNETNDRYFTRNSLNTQGLGLIMKKDFNGWRDFFGINSNKKRKKKKDNKKDK